MNVREIARLCGVSPATVSRVLNGSAPVNQDTRRRIEQAMAQHSYTPKPLRHSAKKAGIIGVLLPDIRQSFFRAVLTQLDKKLSGSDMISLILPCNPKNEDNCLRYLSQAPLDGVILLEEETSPDIFLLLEERGIPVVMCGVMALNNRLSAVHVDDLAASYDGTRYLLELGHREIGFISESSHAISSGFQRITGSKKALQDHGLTPREEQYVEGGDAYEHGYQGALRLLERMPGLTAIFAFSDVAAVGVMDALAQKGLRVPEDISVLGFDDVDVGVGTPPILTSVHQPIGDFVSKTLDLLTEMRRTRTKKVSSVILPHSITQRQTCQSPAKADESPCPTLEKE